METVNEVMYRKIPSPTAAKPMPVENHFSGGMTNNKPAVRKGFETK
jgi:hypothetical protein